MPKNIIRQSQSRLFSKNGLRHVSAVILRHKRLTAVSVAALLVAAPIASYALANGGSEAPYQSHSEASEQPSSQALSTRELSGELEQHAPEEKEDQPMQSDIKAESHSNSQGGDSPEVDVTVNGQHIPVPHNGSVHKRMTGSEGESTVDIQVNNSTDTNNSSSSTVIIEQHSHSTGSEASNSDGNSRHPDRR